MKKLLFFTIIIIFASNIIAQNVGIGTTTPTDKLSVVNSLPGYGITHTYGSVTLGTYLTNLNGQFGTKTNHPLQFFTNNGNPQMTLLQNGNTGIGTQVPTEKLQVVGNVLSEGIDAGFRFNDRTNNNKGYQWYSSGGNAYFHSIQAPNVKAISVLENNYIGLGTSTPQTQLHVNPAGAGSILVGFNKNLGGYTNLEMGISSISDGYSYIQSTRQSGSLYGRLALNPSGGDVTVGGNVGIGTNVPNSPLDIQSPGLDVPCLRILAPSHIWGLGLTQSSNFSFLHNGLTKAWIDNTDGSYNYISDKRVKKNIEEISPVLNKVLHLKAKEYQFIDGEETKKKSTGFISQEVMELFPEFVSEFKRNAADTNTYYGINYAGFSVIAIKAIQEQQQIIGNQQKEIDVLKEQMKLILNEKAITKF